jgi:hypothetical protein
MSPGAWSDDLAIHNINEPSQLVVLRVVDVVPQNESEIE